MSDMDGIVASGSLDVSSTASAQQYLWNHADNLVAVNDQAEQAAAVLWNQQGKGDGPLVDTPLGKLTYGQIFQLQSPGVIQFLHLDPNALGWVPAKIKEGFAAGWLSVKPENFWGDFAKGAAMVAGAADGINGLAGLSGVGSLGEGAVTASDLAAADASGGLLPQFGTNAAYDAAIGASQALPNLPSLPSSPASSPSLPNLPNLPPGATQGASLLQKLLASASNPVPGATGNNLAAQLAQLFNRNSNTAADSGLALPLLAAGAFFLMRE